MTERKEFAKIFSTYMLTLILPIVVVGIIVLAFLLGNISERTKDLNKRITEQCVENIDSEISSFLRMATQLMEEDEVCDLLEKKWTQRRDLNFKAWKTIEEISIYINNNQMFADIAIFSNNNDCFVNSTSVFDEQEYYNLFVKKAEVDEESFNKALHKKQKSYFYLTNGEIQESADYLFLCKSIEHNNQHTGTILFCIKKNAFIERIFGKEKNSSLEFALVAKNGQYAFNTSGCNPKLIEYGKKKGKSGIYQNGKSNIIVSQSRQTGDLYVFHITKDEFSGNTFNMSLFFLLIILLILYISILVARKKIKAIKSVFEDYTNKNILLSDKLGEYLSIAKKSDMLNSLRNHFDVWGNPIKYDFNLQYKKSVVFVINTIDDTNLIDVSEELTNKVFLSACDDVVKEFTQKGLICDYARTEERVCVFVLNYDKMDYGEFKELVAQVMESYNLQYYLGAGEETEKESRLAQSYDEALIALKYAKRKKTSSAVLFSEIETTMTSEVRYSPEKEKNLLRAIKLGLCDNAKEIFEEIYEEHYDAQHEYLPKRLIFLLINTLYSAADEAYEGNFDKMAKIDRIFKNISGMQEVQAFEVLQEVGISIAKNNKETEKQDMLSIRILECIDKLYLDPNFSLQMLSDELNLNYYYMSRVFTELFGVKFVSFITEKRIEHAKELLVKTNKSVEEISSIVGFMHASAFISVFKKYFGVTPGQYRKNNQQQ